MADKDITAMAHLMRRAGFGVAYGELEVRAAKGYDATLEELLHPEQQPELETDVLERYFPDWVDLNDYGSSAHYFTYRLINGNGPLQEKMALFWHGILCTGNSKCEQGKQVQLQLDMFRRIGMGSFPTCW